jgi:hypothetical protein
MRVEKECPCCGAAYMIRFEQILAELDVDESYDAEPQDDQDDGLYPEYCPFCGAHDSEEDDDSDE